MPAADTFRSYLDCFNSADVAGLARLYAEETEFLNPFSPVPLTTRADIEAFVGSMFAAYSDMHAEADSPVADESWIATRMTITSRHTAALSAPSGVIAATGKVIRLRTAEFIHVDGAGLIVLHERIFDTAAVTRQLEGGH